MAERLITQCCAGCILLDQDRSNGFRKQKIPEKVKLRCCRNGHIPKYVHDRVPHIMQAELECCGCHKANTLYPGDVIRCESMFGNKSRNWLYCGTVEGNKKLLYDRKNKEYKVNPKDWFRAQTGKIRNGISIIWHDKNRKEWCRRQAKRYKEEWLKEHG